MGFYHFSAVFFPTVHFQVVEQDTPQAQISKALLRRLALVMDGSNRQLWRDAVFSSATKHDTWNIL